MTNNSDEKMLVDDEDVDDDMTSSSEDEGSDNENFKPVELGFAKKLTEYESYRLQPHFLPLGKIGGCPSWIAYKPLPKSEELACKICLLPMSFLVQLYAPIFEKECAFHRAIYVFICKNPQCSQPNTNSNVKAFRIQLPRENDFHPYNNLFDPDTTEPDERPKKEVTDFSPLCVVCGCLGNKRCGRCTKVQYCSRAHQELHWRTGHKNECVDSVMNKDVKSPTTATKTEWCFAEFELELERETRFAQPKKSTKSEKARLEEYRSYLNENRDHLSQFAMADAKVNQNGANLDGEATFDCSGKHDVIFNKFQQRVAYNPKQILRYNRNDLPLLASKIPIHQPPKCSVCNGERSFEFQLMPHLLDLLGLDTIGQSVDFATLLVYTCKQDCDVEGKYVEEYIVKQDFD